jgi:hypothetical protein
MVHAHNHGERIDHRQKRLKNASLSWTRSRVKPAMSLLVDARRAIIVHQSRALDPNRLGHTVFFFPLRAFRSGAPHPSRKGAMETAPASAYNCPLTMSGLTEALSASVWVLVGKGCREWSPRPWWARDRERGEKSLDFHPHPRPLPSRERGFRGEPKHYRPTRKPGEPLLKDQLRCQVIATGAPT